MSATRELCCFHCLAAHTPDHQVCTGCHVATYCSKKCQKASWKDGHNEDCDFMRTIVLDSPHTGNGMYVPKDTKAGTVVWKEGMMAAVETQETSEDTCKMLGQVLAHHYKGWADCGLSTFPWAELVSAEGLSEEEQATMANEVAAINTCQPNSYTRWLGGGEASHEAFFMGGCYFNSSGKSNADSMVCWEDGRLVLRVFLHEDLKEGDQVLLGKKFDGECRCNTCLSGILCSNHTLSMKEMSYRLAINMGVAELFDEEIYLRYIMRMGESVRCMSECLEPAELKKWMDENQPSMIHLARMARQTSSKQA